MDARQAARIAIESVQEFFGDQAVNVGLEEIDLIPVQQHWNITVGFFRPWDFPDKNPWQLNPSARPHREYKMVLVEDLTGNVLSIRNREVPEAIAV